MVVLQMKNKSINILFICLVLFQLSTVNAQTISRIKDINLTELQDTVELNVSSNKNLQYNVVNYMNGDIGIKFINSSLDSKNNEIPLTVSQKDSIQDAYIVQESPGTVEIKLKGDNYLSKKRVNVHNDVKKSNIILIEDDSPGNKLNLLPINPNQKNLPDLTPPSINTKALQTDINSFDKANLPKINGPISMYSIKNEPSYSSDQKKLLAQAKSNENNIKNILNVNDNSLSKPIASDPSQQVKSEENSQQANFEKKDLSTNFDNRKENGILNFLSKYWLLLGIIIGIIFFVVIGFILLTLAKLKNIKPSEQNTINEINMEKNIEPINTPDIEPVHYHSPFEPQQNNNISDVVKGIAFLKKDLN